MKETICLEDDFGRPKKSFSVTINDLSEGYIHTYPTYCYLVTPKGEFVYPVPSPEYGKLLTKGCSTNWKVNRYQETNESLSKRTTEKRFQYSGSHKFLDTFQRRKEAELVYSRTEDCRMTRQIRETEYNMEKRRLKRLYETGVDESRRSGYVSLETKSIMQKVRIEDRARKIAEEMMNV